MGYFRGEDNDRKHGESMKPQGAIVLAIGLFIAVIAIRGSYKTMFPSLFANLGNTGSGNGNILTNPPQSTDPSKPGYVPPVSPFNCPPGQTYYYKMGKCV
jgi:hypothetical protein